MNVAVAVGRMPPKSMPEGLRVETLQLAPLPAAPGGVDKWSFLDGCEVEPDVGFVGVAGSP